MLWDISVYQKCKTVQLYVTVFTVLLPQYEKHKSTLLKIHSNYRLKNKIIHVCDMSIIRGVAAPVSTNHRRWQDSAYMFVLAVDVNHSPAKPIMSSPVDSWLKKRGWPEKRIESNLEQLRRYRSRFRFKPSSSSDTDGKFALITHLKWKTAPVWNR